MEKLEDMTSKLSVKLGNRIEEGDPNVLESLALLGKRLYMMLM